MIPHYLSLPMHVAEAVKQGWRPARIESSHALACLAGCGRSMTVGLNDTTVNFTCVECRDAANDYVAQRARAKATAKKAKETSDE